MKIFKGSIDKVFDIFSQIEDVFAVIGIDDNRELYSNSFYDFFKITNKEKFNFEKFRDYIEEDFLKLQSNIQKKFTDLNLKTDKKQILCSGKILNFEKNKYIILSFKEFINNAIDEEEVKEKIKETLEKQAKKNVEKKLNSYIFAQKHLLSLLPTAVAVYGKNKRLKYCNRSFLLLWNLDESWASQKPTYGEMLEKLREKRLLPEQSNFQAFKEQQIKTLFSATEPQEDFLYLPNGKAIRSALIPSTDGKLIFAYDDLTDKLTLESSYNTLIAVQKETLDNLREGVVVFGENGRMKLFNNSFLKMWNINKEKLEPEAHFSEILDEIKKFCKYKGEWIDYKNQLINNLISRKIETIRIERTDNKIIDFLIIPLPDGGSLCYHMDITDSAMLEKTLREKNKALEEADRLKTDFLENISYELRSPLTSIMGFSEILLHNYFGKLNEKQEECVGNVFSASKKLNYLIDNILNLATIEAGYMELDIQDIRIKELINSVAFKMKKQAENKSISINLVYPEDIETISGDENRIKQSLIHLITNAIKFTANDGTITIGVERKVSHEEDNIDENYIMLWVKDSGVGISKDEQKTIFNRFHKVDVVKGGNSGVGIGLSLVKRIINLHGGDIELESTKGEGTKVICLIPQSLTLAKNNQNVYSSELTEQIN